MHFLILLIYQARKLLSAHPYLQYLPVESHDRRGFCLCFSIRYAFQDYHTRFRFPQNLHLQQPWLECCPLQGLSSCRIPQQLKDGQMRSLKIRRWTSSIEVMQEPQYLHPCILHRFHPYHPFGHMDGQCPFLLSSNRCIRWFSLLITWTHQLRYRLQLLLWRILLWVMRRFLFSWISVQYNYSLCHFITFDLIYCQK